MTKRFKINLAREEIKEDLTGETLVDSRANDTTVSVDENAPAEAAQSKEVEDVASYDKVEEAAAQYQEDVLAEKQAEEAARVRDVAAGLEDLAEIVDVINERNKDAISPVQRALIQVTANMAVAGTDVDATALVPGAAEGPIDGDAIRQKARDMRRVADSVAPAASDAGTTEEVAPRAAE